MFGTAARRLRVRGAAPVLHVPSDGNGNAAPAGGAAALVASSRWRTVKQQDLQERKGGEKEKETSELAKASGSAESKSCGGCQLPPFHCGCPFFCRESTRQMERFRSGLQVQAETRTTPNPLILGLQRKKTNEFGTPGKGKSAWICAAGKEKTHSIFMRKTTTKRSPLFMLWKSTETHPKLSILKKQKLPSLGKMGGEAQAV
ncbi:uncharacterized protein LOC115345234 isoform X2 [Aquila chrysaetos chrysaetos]|uniref:uncharacterized protein LOC115345234 isoform X2 n=1 Tax=Aquila chrysaetos chrysaetos TaxID=223781 RepID=UPI001B7D2EF4|nr:uncharacterized protein LOC115345234 isoform X2 [Aquila chrysaetos chrysaetos]